MIMQNQRSFRAERSGVEGIPWRYTNAMLWNPSTLLGMMSWSCSYQRVLEFLGQLRCLISERAFPRNLFLQFHQAGEQRFRTRWTPRDVDVDRQKLIDALQHSVGTIHPAGGGARAHGDYPFRFGHLLINSFYSERHLVRDGARDDHHVTLTGGEAHHFRAEPRNIESRRSRGHQLDGATGQSHRHWPKRILSHPVERSIKLCENYVAFDLRIVGRRA